MRRFLAAFVVVLLATFYVAAAKEHGTRINVSKARGDQSGYLMDAENVYANWHGRQPPVLIGERNRMPLYAGYLALSYRPTMSDQRFFEIGKRRNIYLSLLLLAALYPILRRYLAPHPARNLLLVTAFGSFIFKASYVQSDLLFYFLFFAAFALILELIRRPFTWPATTARAIGAGRVGGLAHLSKAAAMPLIGIAGVVLLGMGLWEVRARKSGGRRILAAVLMATAFFAVLSPYLLENKRAFGRYLYNVNTTFYMWYDDWPQASGGTIQHGDGVGWPTMPAADLPSASRYWSEHTIGQILARVGHGFVDMLARSYTTYRYLSYVTVYLLFAAAVLISQRRLIADWIRPRAAVVLFAALYAGVYLMGIAFYEPISGTGTSLFLIAHLLPGLFLLSLFASTPAATQARWRVGGVEWNVSHFHWLVSALLTVDIVFTVWPRLMTTYGGF